MDKQLKLWIDILEKTKENIIGTLNYNGLIIDDMEELIRDMKRAQAEAKNHIRLCDRCTKNKFVQDNICKQCAYTLRPWDTGI